MASQTTAQHFDKTALVEIYEQYNPKLYRYAYRLLGDEGLANNPSTLVTRQLEQERVRQALLQLTREQQLMRR